MEEKKDFNYLLPLGTVLTLKGKEHKIMITAYLIKLDGSKLKDSDKKAKVEGKIFDYMGVLWPEGDFDSTQKILFNHDTIGNIFFYGYNDEQFIAFQNLIKEGMASQKEEEKKSDNQGDNKETTE